MANSWQWVYAGFGIARVTANGALDPSFDGDGLLAPALAGVAKDPVAIQPDGGIIAAGYALPPGGDTFGAALLRVNGDGSLDNNFGSAGPGFRRSGQSRATLVRSSCKQMGE